MKRRKDGFQGERSIVLPREIIEQEAGDPLVSSLYVTDIGYYPAAKYHYRERPHAIQQHVLIYCMSGSGWYRVGQREYHVRSGEYFILPAGVPHAYGTNEQDPWTVYWLHFQGDHAAIYAQGALQPQPVQPNMQSRIGYRNNLFEEIFTTLSRDHSLDALRYVSSLLHYYLASMRYLQQYREATESEATESEAAESEKGTPGRDKPDGHNQPASAARRKAIDEEAIAKAAVHYLHENIEHRLTVDDMAAYIGYSVSHFATIFRRQTGQSPLHYFNRLKIEQACEMLRSTDIQINQLCFKVGIDDPYYFSRLFKRITGVSPQQYRDGT